MKPDLAAIASALGIGAAIGSVVTLLLKDHLARRSERRRRQVETDRATYQARMTRLIGANLCAFIRSDRCREGEREDLAELIQELSDGAHREGFLDPKVQAAWLLLVKKSAECGWRRLAGVITEQEIADYTQIWEAWQAAARESFGPLPESDPPRLRRSAAGRTGDAA